MSQLRAKEEQMYHDALQQLLVSYSKIPEGKLGPISLAMRYDNRAGQHVHASAKVTQTIRVTVMEDEILPDTKKY
jgi:hypothetical protein